MDLTLILTIIGIFVAIIIGVWQIYLAQKQIKGGALKSDIPSINSTVARQEKDTKELVEQSSNKTNTILWIEDDIEEIYSLVSPLEKEGFKILTATSLNKTKEILLSGQKFDLIITDLIFPDGDEKSDKDGQATYHGLEVVRLARELLGRIPILCVTVVRTPEILEELHKMGVECLHKPIRPSVLVETVKLILLEYNSPDKNEAILGEVKRRQIELTSDSPYIRRRAIWALGELGHFDSTIINSLKEINKTDKDISVREAAKEAVNKIQRRLKKSTSKRR